jgi:protein-S-isoprenylcysteine O-methyltransferase Ste14
MLLLMLVAEVGLAFIPATRLDLPWGFRLGGGLLLVSGVALNVAATRQFARRHTPVRPSAEPGALVTDGVFRFSRNPMYLGIALILVGAALALATPLGLITVPVFVWWVGLLIREEERKLTAHFGDAFLHYRQRVRRWL